MTNRQILAALAQTLDEISRDGDEDFVNTILADVLPILDNINGD